MGKVRIPGGSGITLLTLAFHFKSGLSSGHLTARAAAISFKFFLAFFPGILFLFTIIPLIPLKDFQTTLMLTLQQAIPDPLFPLIEKTILDIITIRHTGLLSFGFLMALYFSSSSFISLISSFNQSININESRSPWQQRILSLLLMIVSTILIIIAISIMIIGRDSIRWLIDNHYITDPGNIAFFFTGRWFVLAAMVYLIISMIYYFAPARSVGFRFFSVGSLIATLFIVAMAWGFGYFIRYFSAHNALYGSVGTLLLLLLYVYYNAIILLVGFELNASIVAAKRKNAASAQEELPQNV